MADSWYPSAEEYYVPEVDAPEYPPRQGDVFPSPGDGELATWAGFVVVSPSCEVQKKNVNVQVARVRRIPELEDDYQRTAVTYGFDTRDPAIVRVAFAHTFWMPPAVDAGPLSDDLFVDFREVETVPQNIVSQGNRARALTHDARVYFIRRKVFYRYRWLLSVDEVRALEAERIASDDNFAGPRPAWAAMEPGPYESA